MKKSYHAWNPVWELPYNVKLLRVPDKNEVFPEGVEYKGGGFTKEQARSYHKSHGKPRK